MEVKDDSDMEGWEDDGWGDFDPIPRQDPVSAAKPPQQMSSGADFFDSIGTRKSTRTKAKDLFEDFGYPDNQSAKSSGREHTPPLLTSASLFGSSKPAGGSVADKDDEGGWGDWDEDFDVKPAASKVCVCCLCGDCKFTFGLNRRTKAKELGA